MANKRTNRDNSTAAPISGHRLFPAVVALWCAAALGLVCAVIPASAIESVIAISGIAAIFPAASGSLPLWLHAALAGVAGLLGWGAGLAIARRFAVKQFEEQPASSDRIARIRRIQPISAYEELGSGGFDSLASPEAVEEVERFRTESYLEREEFFTSSPQPEDEWQETPTFEEDFSAFEESAPQFGDASAYAAPDLANVAEPAAEPPAPDTPTFDLPGLDVGPGGWDFPPHANDDWHGAETETPDEPDGLSPEFAFGDEPVDGVEEEAPELYQASEAAIEDSREPGIGLSPNTIEFGPFRIDANFAEGAETADLPNQVPTGLDSFGEEEEEDWDESALDGEFSDLGDVPPPFDATLGAFRDYARDYIGGDDGEEEEQEEEDEDEDSNVSYGSLLGLTVRRPPPEEPLELVGFDGQTVTKTNDELMGEDLFGDDDDSYDDESGSFEPLDSPLLLRRRSGGGL